MQYDTKDDFGDKKRKKWEEKEVLPLFWGSRKKN